MLPHVLAFGLIAMGIWGLSALAERYAQLRLGLQVAPYEIAGGALSLLLTLRTTAGYERWWKARKLWGGIISQSRNLAISALNYGPGGSSLARNHHPLDRRVPRMWPAAASAANFLLPKSPA